MTTKRVGRLALLLVFAAAATALYVYGAVQQSRLQNQDWTRSDQSAYMGFSRSMRESNYRYMGDWNRMPLYPGLQSLLYRTGMGDEELFVRGKWLNVILSIVLLAAMYAVFRHYLPWHSATNLLLITAFTLFVVKAPYFQSELLFYGLNFFAFVMAIEMLRRPTWPRAVLTGVLWGLGHLVKASVLPGVVLFLFWAALHALKRWRDRVHRGGADAHYMLLRRLLCAALAGVVFLAVIYPYIRESKRVFGHYFYNVNSTFYMWYDSWAEAKEGTRAHGDRFGWPDMPADQIPSPYKYLREHTARQMLDRIVAGATRMLNDAAYVPKFAYGYSPYVVAFSLAALVAALVTRRQNGESCRRWPFLAFYLVTYFLAYGFLYTWFMPIGRGNRFALGQFVPYMFVMCLFLAQPAVQELRVRVGNRNIRSVNLFHSLISLALIPHIYYILTTVVRIADGGN